MAQASLAVSGAAAACGRSPDSAAPARSAAAPVQITYWKSLTGPRHDAQVKLTDDFNASQDRVRVTLEHVGEYNPAAEKLRVALASGADIPDAMMISTNSDLPYFGRLGALQPLGEYARRDPGAHVEGFYRGLVADGKVGDTLYQLPFARSAAVLYLNLDVLRAAGAPETPPATWDDLLATSRQVVRSRSAQPASEELSEAGAPEAALGVTTSYWEFQPLLWAFGGAYSDAQLNVHIDSPPSIAAGQYLADLAHRHQVAVPTKAAMIEFLQARRAFFLGSTASLTQIKGNPLFRAALAPLPAPAAGMGGTRGVPGSGAGLSILAPVPRLRRDAAWQFITFMTGATSTAYFAQATGYAPVRPEALDLPEMRRFLEQYPDAVVAQAQFDTLRPVDPILGTPFAGLHIEDALQRILFDRADVRQTFGSLAGELRQGR